MSDAAVIEAPAEPVVVPVDSGTPVETPPPLVEAVAEPSHTETPTLLTGERPAEAPVEEAAPVEEKPAEEPKPAEEAKPAEEPKPAEEAKAEPEAVVPPEPLTYEPPELPEGITLDSGRVKEFDEVIGQHRLPQEARQQLVDMFIGERAKWEEEASRNQHRAFAETRRGWRDEVLADEQIGGAGHHTALASCMKTIDLFVPAGQREQFDSMLSITGAGDHPAMLRFLHSVARKFDAPATSEAPRNPPPDRGGAGGRGRGMRDLYDNPRSQTG